MKRDPSAPPADLRELRDGMRRVLHLTGVEMRTHDNRGRPLNFEAGQIRHQDYAFGGGGRYRAPAASLRTHLDRLASALDREGRPDAPISLTAGQYAEAEELLRYAALDGSGLRWRRHLLLKAAEEPKK